MRTIKKLVKRILKILKAVWNFVMQKPYHESFGSYWKQEVEVTRIKDREAFFFENCRGKRVLHFGCTDWPIFRPEHNLHIKLAKYADVLHGFDIDVEGIEALKAYVDQEYYSEFDQVPDNEAYDLCLIPETIEHVDNIRTFLEGVTTINAKKFMITGPNCFSEETFSRQFSQNSTFTEVVHPDHNCWFSPYTLKNQIEKYSGLKVTRTYLIAKDTIVCCEAVKA